MFISRVFMNFIYCMHGGDKSWFIGYQHQDLNRHYMKWLPVISWVFNKVERPDGHTNFPPEHWVVKILYHDDVNKWKHFPPYWPFVRGIHRSPENSSVTGEFPAQRPVTRNFDVFLDLCLNKRLSKLSWGCWFETPPRPLWRHSFDKIPSPGKKYYSCLSKSAVNYFTHSDKFCICQDNKDITVMIIQCSWTLETAF